MDCAARQRAHRQGVGRLHRWFSGSDEEGKQMNNVSKFESNSRFLTWFMALLLSALVAGCGGGGGGGDPVLGISGPGGAPDLTAKAITSYSLPGVGGFQIAGVIDQGAKTILVSMRSEERRVGKECRSRW